MALRELRRGILIHSDFNAKKARSRGPFFVPFHSASSTFSESKKQNDDSSLLNAVLFEASIESSARHADARGSFHSIPVFCFEGIDDLLSLFALMLAERSLLRRLRRRLVLDEVCGRSHSDARSG